jgi:hypothetical protein
MQFGESRHTGAHAIMTRELLARRLAQTLHAPRRPWPVMVVGMMMAVVAMRNFAFFGRLERHAHDLAVPYAALGDHVFAEMLDVVGLASEHRDLETGVMVEMHVQRSERQLMMLVIGGC